MKILIIGNLGYIGPILSKHLRTKYKNIYIAGFDIGYFEHVLTYNLAPEIYLDVQFRGDVRFISADLLKGFDSIIYLAAISNDPMGNNFKNITIDVNYKSAIKVAKLSKKAGVENFVFASSCSIYGTADVKPRTENSPINPLTSYAKSKVMAEDDLCKLSSENFKVTCLRFATACGFSPRMRLDLVLNDFVASALITGKISILSDGMPWRPLIHVKDMANAIDWAAKRELSNGGCFVQVNSGSNDFNFTIKDLANAVTQQFENVVVSINKDAEADKRSYQVDFTLFSTLAPDYTPVHDVYKAVQDIKEGLQSINFNDPNYRESNLIRLNVLRNHINSGRLNNNLEWNL